MSRVTTVLFFPFKFFLMEKAGRRRLLLTGFISIAVCNLFMTIVDSVLVRSTDSDCFFHLHRKSYFPALDMYKISNV